MVCALIAHQASLFAEFLLVFVLAAEGAFAWSHLRQAERADRTQRKLLNFEVYRHLLNMIDEYRSERQVLERVLPEDTTAFAFAELPDDQKTSFEQIARSYDRLAMLAAQGVVDIRFVLEFHTRAIVMVWHRLGPYVLQRRVERKQKGHMHQFHMLAIEARMYRIKRYRDEETFAVSPGDQEAWRTWRDKRGIASAIEAWAKENPDLERYW